MASADSLKIILEAIDNASVQIKGVQSNIETLSKTATNSTAQINSAFNNAGRAVFSYAASFASIGAAVGFLKTAFHEAQDNEKSQGQLKRQVQASGVSWQDYGGAVEQAVRASADYAVVQESETRPALARLILITNDVRGSMDNLKLTMDLATARNLDYESAAMLVGRAMEGNISMLTRMLPELSGMEKALGENATTAEKAAFALDLLHQRVDGAAGAMSDNIRIIKELKKDYLDFAETTGGVLLPVLKDMTEGFRAMGHAVRDSLQWLAGYNPEKIAEKSATLKSLDTQIVALEETMRQMGTVPPLEFGASQTKEQIGALQVLQSEMDKLISKRDLLAEIESKSVSAIKGQGAGLDANVPKIKQKIELTTEELKHQKELNEYLHEMSVWEMQQSTIKRGDFKFEGMEALKLEVEPLKPEEFIPPTFGGTLKALLDENVYTPMQQTAMLAKETMMSMVRGVGDAVASAIIYGKDLGEALMDVFKRAAAGIISGLIQIGIQQLILSVIGKSVLAGEASTRMGVYSGLTLAATTANLALTLGPLALPAAQLTTAAMMASALAFAGAGMAVGAGMAAIPMAEGGIVTKPTFALIGEAGPEMVIPLKKKGAAGIAAATTINFNGPLLGDAQQARFFAKAIDKELNSLKRRNLSLAFGA